MKIKRISVALAAALSLISAPVMAGIENLSVASAQRDSSPVNTGENLKGGHIFGALIAIGMIIGASILAFDNNNENEPTSP